MINNLANIPTNLDINRSKNAEVADSLVELVAIWRYGLNSVRIISPIEKRSKVSPIFVLKFLKNIPHPRKYHQEIRSVKNMLLLYHKRYTFDKIY